MTGLIKRFVIFLLKKSISGSAKPCNRGITGNIGIPILFLPLICSAIFATFGWLAIGDPDQDDRLVGFASIGLSGLIILYFFHLFSFRILATDDAMIASSLLSKEKVINLKDKFDLIEEDDDDTISVHQGNSNIKISWIIRGHSDFQDLLLMAHRRSN